MAGRVTAVWALQNLTRPTRLSALGCGGVMRAETGPLGVPLGESADRSLGSAGLGPGGISAVLGDVCLWILVGSVDPLPAGP